MTKKHKKYTELEFPDEGIKDSGYLINGKREGIWKISYDDCLRETVTYKNNEINGLVTLFEQDDDGEDVKVAEGIQKMILDRGIGINSWHGEVKFWDIYGNLKQIDNYKKGKLHGTSIWYAAGRYYKKEDATNKIDSAKNYKNGLLHGKETDFADSGRVTITHHKEGVKHGVEEEFYKNGALKSKLEWVNGKIEGLYETFHEDGKIQTRGNWKNGLRHGQMEVFSPYSMWKSNYEYGYQDGILEDYDPKSKTIRSRGAYISLEKIEKKETVLKIERDSKFRLPYLKNKKIPTTNCIGFFTFGPTRISLKDGVWEYFYENGKCKTRVNFKNGKRVVKA